MTEMTFSEYDELLDDFNKMKKVPPLWPSIEQIDMFETDEDRWLTFAVYLLEKNPHPRNAKERYSKKNLLAYVNRHLTLFDRRRKKNHKKTMTKVIVQIAQRQYDERSNPHKH